MADCFGAINEDEDWRSLFHEKAEKLFISVKFDMNNN
jgi:hypothetical protein